MKTKIFIPIILFSLIINTIQPMKENLDNSLNKCNSAKQIFIENILLVLCTGGAIGCQLLKNSFNKKLKLLRELKLYFPDKTFTTDDLLNPEIIKIIKYNNQQELFKEIIVNQDSIKSINQKSNFLDNIFWGCIVVGGLIISKNLLFFLAKPKEVDSTDEFLKKLDLNTNSGKSTAIDKSIELLTNSKKIIEQVKNVEGVPAQAEQLESSIINLNEINSKLNEVNYPIINQDNPEPSAPDMPNIINGETFKL